MSQNIIYGKKINDYLLNEEELQLLNKPINDIFSKPDDLKKFKKLFRKIYNLASVHKNILNMFESFNMSTKNSIKSAENSFNFKSFLATPEQFITNSKIGNTKLSSENTNFFKSRIRTSNGKSVTNNNFAKIDKSIFTLFLLFNKLQKYIFLKKAEFNQLIKSRVNTENKRAVIKKLNGFRLIVKKFIAIREKLFKLINFQYVEPPIKVGTIINQFYYYHHFLRYLKDSLIPQAKVKVDYDNYVLGAKNSNTTIGPLQVNIISKNSTGKATTHVFNPKSTSNGINYSIQSGTPNKDSITLSNLISLYYIDNTNPAGRIDTIITKRNNDFYMYKYTINASNPSSLSITKSEKPQRIYFDETILKNTLLEDKKDKNNLGTLSRIYISLTTN